MCTLGLTKVAMLLAEIQFGFWVGMLPLPKNYMLKYRKLLKKDFTCTSLNICVPQVSLGTKGEN
jgi:hypothetical protein